LKEEGGKLNLSLIDNPDTSVGGKIVDTTNLGSGMRINLKTPKITAYNFTLRGESTDIETNTAGSYI
jgi:hypothetical protein